MFITFSHDDVSYTIPYEAIGNTNLIVLPDGVVLAVTAWLESYPPQVGDYVVFEHDRPDLQPEDLATILGAPLATVAL